jgi:hypothetical protein
MTVSWLSLTQATTILDHDIQRARESLGRAISKAGIVGPSGSPACARHGCLLGHLSQSHLLNREQRSKSAGRTLGAYGAAQKVQVRMFRPLGPRPRLVTP